MSCLRWLTRQASDSDVGEQQPHVGFDLVSTFRHTYAAYARGKRAPRFPPGFTVSWRFRMWPRICLATAEAADWIGD
jgi:hypothetical protein